MRTLYLCALLMLAPALSHAIAAPTGLTATSIDTSYTSLLSWTEDPEPTRWLVWVNGVYLYTPTRTTSTLSGSVRSFVMQSLPRSTSVVISMQAAANANPSAMSAAITITADPIRVSCVAGCVGSTTVTASITGIISTSITSGVAGISVTASQGSPWTVSGSVSIKSEPTGIAVNVSNSTLAVTESGTWTVQPGNTVNTTAWLVSDSDTAKVLKGATSTAAPFYVNQSGTWNVNSLESGTWTMQPGNTPNTIAWLMSDSNTANVLKGATSTSSPWYVNQNGTWNISNISGTISLPTGASTAALQTTGNSSLSSLDGKTTAVNTGAVVLNVAATGLAVNISNTPAVTCAACATSANQTTIISAFNNVTVNTHAVTQSGTWNVNSTPSGGAQAVSVITSVLPTGAATSANQTTIISAFSNVTVNTHAITAASLPLPTGAATSALQAYASTGLAVNVSNTVTVGGTLTTAGNVSLNAGTSVIGSLGTAGNVSLNAGTSAIGSVTLGVAATGLAVNVSNTTLATTQSGTWTVQPGNTANTTAWLVSDSNTANVLKGATSTAAPIFVKNIGIDGSTIATAANAVPVVASVTSTVTVGTHAVTQGGPWTVSGSVSTAGNVSLNAGTSAIGSVTIGAPTTGQTVNVSNTVTTVISSATTGLAVNVSNSPTVVIGAASTGQAVNVSNTVNTNTVINSATTGLAVNVSNTTLAVTESGTWTVQPGNTANTTAWKVDGSAVTQPVSFGGGISVTNPASAAVQVAGTITNTAANAVQVAGSITNTVTTVISSATTGLAVNVSNTVNTLTTLSLATTGLAVNISNTPAVTCATCATSALQAYATTGLAVNVSNTVNTSDTQSGTWTIQPGNTQNTTSWLVSDSNTANVLKGATSTSAPFYVNQNGTWNINNVAGTISLPTGAATSSLQTTGNTSLSSILSAFSNVTVNTHALSTAGNVSLNAGTSIIGALSANQSVNVAQINGVSPSMGSGANGTGVQRITVATDQAYMGVTCVSGCSSTTAYQGVSIQASVGLAVTLLAGTASIGTVVIGAPTTGQTVNVSNTVNTSDTQSGTWTVQPGNTPNTTSWLVSDSNTANVLKSATSTSAPFYVNQNGVWTLGTAGNVSLNAGTSAIGSVTIGAPVTGQTVNVSNTVATTLSVPATGLTVNVSNTVNTSDTQSGTWTVQPGNTANTTAWLVSDSNTANVLKGATGTSAPFYVNENGTWTVQPGNTANTTAWLVSDSNTANVLKGSTSTAAPLFIKAIGVDGSTIASATNALPVVASVTNTVTVGTHAVTQSGVFTLGTAGNVSLNAGTSVIGSLVTAGNVSLNAGTSVIGSLGTAGNVSLNAGTSAIGSVTIGAPTTGQTVNVSNTVTAVISSASTGLAVNVSNTVNTSDTQSGTWTVQPGNTPNTTAWLVSDSNTANVLKGATSTAAPLFVNLNTLPTLTKGTQGATGFSVQALIDAGRANKTFYTTAAVVPATTVEGSVTLTAMTDTGVTTTALTFTPTNGKRFRITSMTFATNGNSVATAYTVTFTMRLAASSPDKTSANAPIKVRSSGPATAGYWDRLVVPIPDGFELLGNGSMAWTLTVNATYVTNAPTIDVFITGFEY